MASKKQQFGQAEEGDNRHYIEFGRALQNLPNIDTNSYEEVARRCNEWLDICSEFDIRPSLENLALAIHVHKDSLYKWVRGDRKKPEDVLHVIDRMYQLINEQATDMMLANKAPAVPSIFIHKNNFGYKDQSETITTRVQLLGEEVKAEDIQAKYLGTPQKELEQKK